MTLHTYEKQVSSEAGRERMVRIPYARLKDQTPTIKDPFCVTAAIAGMEMCGTVITIDATDSVIIGNVAEGAVFTQEVRNVITYDGANNENGWRAINIGDPVFYDVTSDANNGVKLSTSPLMGDAATANPRFGIVIMDQDETAASFAKGNAQGGSNNECAVLQCGLNES